MEALLIFASLFEDYLWLVLCILLILLVVIRLRKRLNVYEAKRKQQVLSRRRFEAIATDTPHSHPVMAAKQIGIKSIETRFSQIRKFLFPVLIILASPFMVWPFLDRAPTAIISLVVGSFTVVMSIAAKPFIENLISGLVISVGYPLRIGDTVEVDGNYGTVEKIALTYCVIKIWDWRRYIVPNSKVLTKEFVNLSYTDMHIWAQVEFHVSERADLDAVSKLAYRVTKESKFFSPIEEPSFWVMSLDEHGIKCWVAAWADTPAYAWELKSDIRLGMAKGLKDLGVSFQQQTVAIKRQPTTK